MAARWALRWGGVDHDRVGLFRLARQFGDAVEHAEVALANEPVVNGLVRAAALGRIAPHQTVLA